MLTDPLVIPQDLVIVNETPTGEEAHFFRVENPGTTSKWKYPLSQTPTTDTWPELLKESNAELKFGSQSSGKGTNAMVRTLARIDGTCVEADLTTHSQCGMWVVALTPANLVQRPVALALHGAQMTLVRNFLDTTFWAALMDGQR